MINNIENKYYERKIPLEDKFGLYFLIGILSGFIINVIVIVVTVFLILIITR